MDLGGITQSKISQTEKDKYQMISFICGILKKKERDTKPEFTGKQTGAARVGR